MKNTKTNRNEETYRVHARLGEMFEDIYVKARNEKEAIEKAAKQLKGTQMESRWTRYMI